MSLTRHQQANSIVWEVINDAIDQQKIESAVTQINAVCYSKQIIKLREYPRMFNFALTGKAVIYAYILTYHKDLFYKTLVGRNIKDTTPLFKHSDVVVQAVCAALTEDWLRSGTSQTAQKIAGFYSLNAAEFSGPNKALYEDVAQLTAQFPSMDRPIHGPEFNVPPALAKAVGGADVQLTFGPEVWSLHTTLKPRPLSVDKLKQQIAYFLLYCDKNLHSFNGWKELVFYFPRHQQFIKLNPLDYVNRDKAKSLGDQLSEYILESSSAYHPCMFGSDLEF
jgi:hypothetical protein